MRDPFWSYFFSLNNVIIDSSAYISIVSIVLIVFGGELQTRAQNLLQIFEITSSDGGDRGVSRVVEESSPIRIEQLYSYQIKQLPLHAECPLAIKFYTKTCIYKNQSWRIQTLTTESETARPAAQDCTNRVYCKRHES